MKPYPGSWHYKIGERRSPSRGESTHDRLPLRTPCCAAPNALRSRASAATIREAVACAFEQTPAIIGSARRLLRRRLGSNSSTAAVATHALRYPTMSLAFLCSVGSIGSVSAQATVMPMPSPVADTTPVPFNVLPEDDDPAARHRTLGTTSLRALDSVEYMPIGSRGSYFSLGGEVRDYYESYVNENWGSLPGFDGYLLQRYMLHLDARFSPALRAFIELKSNEVGGRRGGARQAVDLDRADINTAFLDLDLVRKPDGGPLATVRLGRQHLNFGAGRVLSIGIGPDGSGLNVLPAFDGARFVARPGSWRIDAFALRPVGVQAGSFDDYAGPSESVTGVYASSGLKHGVEAYVLDVTRQNALYSRGIGDERRFTAGGRVFDSKPSFDYDLELIDQFGTFKNVPIRAYNVALAIGTQFGNAHAPRLGVQAGIASGDRGDPNLMTAFSAPAPGGDYFGSVSLLGPTNIAGFEPSLAIPLGPTLRVTANNYFFWRQARFDGIYNAGEIPLRGTDENGTSYVGVEPEVLVHWDCTPNVSLHAVYSRIYAGSYFATAPPAQNVAYFATWLRLHF